MTTPRPELFAIRIGVLLPALLIFPGLVPAQGDTRRLTGQVVDSTGAPVTGVDVTTYWNANGITKERLQEIQQTKDEIIWRQEGVMQPWGPFTREPGVAQTTTNESGEFVVPILEDDYKLMALDAERKRGGLGLIDPEHPDAPLRIVLQPLVKVHGTVRVDGEAIPRSWFGSSLSLPVHQQFPLGRDRLAFCGSDRSRFAFLLPPGRYVLHAYAFEESTEQQTLLSAETFPDVAITVNGDEPAVNLGEVILKIKPSLSELAAESKSQGTWGDYTKRYGQPAPNWHVDDAKGASNAVQPRDFRGQWLAVYFWGPYCRPCLKTGLPELIDFSRQYADQRDQFEIIAFCLDKDAGLRSIADIEELLEPISTSAWEGRTLDVPILLDNTFETYEKYGLDSVGHLILVDPAGNLYEGDLKTLAKILVSQE